MRPSPTLSRRALLAASGVGIAGMLAACSGASAGEDDAAAAQRVTSISPSSGAVAGGTRVTVLGNGLGDVRTALIGGQRATLASRQAHRVTFVTPAATDFEPATTAVRLQNADGSTIAKAMFRYELTNGIDRQLRYVLTYWKHYNPAYPPLPDNDCVDFASQALLQRGWQQQDDWSYDADNLYNSGAAWLSSTSFRDFMTNHPELGSALTDEQRDRVKLGDIVQFDWERSGDRDHTGTVTRITRANGKTRIFFAGHTDDSDYRSVDTAITKDHPGGVAYYWSLS